MVWALLPLFIGQFPATKGIAMRNSRILVTCVATLLPALCIPVAYGETSSEDFVKHAAQSNLAEIKVSELAQQKAQSADVKKFADQMVQDHTKANEELAQIAKSKNLKVPDDTDMMHKASMKMLQGKSGASFDTAYMEQMDKDHQKAIELFQSASSSPKVDKELQAFATKTLPKLQQHHHMVAQVEAKQPSSSAAADSSSKSR
jgi:putative membrane protein